MSLFTRPQRHHLALAALCISCAAGCANLPDTQDILARHTAQQARFENAHGPVSEKRRAAVLAEFKRRSAALI